MSDPMIIGRDGDPNPLEGNTPRMNGYAIVPKHKWDDVENAYPNRDDLKARLGLPIQEEALKNPEGYICNSFIDYDGREGNSLNFKADAGIRGRLKGYAIVPLEIFTA